MTVRKMMALLSVVCMAALAAPVAASAATPHAVKSVHVSDFKNVPVSGTARNGKTFTGRMNITHFINRNDTTYAVGTLTGTIGRRSIKAQQVAVPVSVPTGSAGTAMRSNATTAGPSCPILHLVLGPLDLNLLGLKVHLNQVVLDITAQSGSGNLLGNLLCGVANLLNGGVPPTAGPGGLAGLLNIVNSLLGTPGLLTL